MVRKPARKSARSSAAKPVAPATPGSEREKIIAAFLALLAEKPIATIRFSASSARNAAMIFSRSLPGVAGATGFAAEDRADLRAGLRTMTELLGNAPLRPQCRPAMGRFQGGARGTPRPFVSRQAPATAWSPPRPRCASVAPGR